ncbi:hypothetical protein BB558_003191 [Smittium angustum]|uniref:Phosphoribosylaminoimidazole carboxylase n=1 Tax=Smittium angustum TaxID=133377 RepID=A0A2U1J6M6_SMIAN|nr:hypothetical protein BB558_003191 [Smittium angustum]
MTFFDKKVGVLGGGQLGRMMIEAAHRLNIELVIVDPQTDSPAKQLSSGKDHIDLPFTDPEAIIKLAEKVDVITAEIEHVDTTTLSEIVKVQLQGKQFRNKKVGIYPSPKTIEVIQDKYRQHVVLHNASIPVAKFADVKDLLGARKIGKEFGYPFLLKAKKGAYDGRGNYVVKDPNELQTAWDTLSKQVIVKSSDKESGIHSDSGIYAEKMANFTKELAVMVVLGLDGETVCYPIVETEQKDNICHLVYTPVPIDGKILEKAQLVATNAVKVLNSTKVTIDEEGTKKTPKSAGVFGVELFLLENNEILVNEVAPRPHNSGHYTIEACETSQYENHLRAILGLPLGSTALKVNYAAMVNILGFSTPEDVNPMRYILHNALKVNGATVHFYGKKEVKKARKMGHITIVASNHAEFTSRVNQINKVIYAGEVLATEKFDPDSEIYKETRKFGQVPLVGIIMGSDSDLPVMKAAAEELRRFGVSFELTIVSAHRTPHRMVEYAESARSRGLKVIIAGAGGAAHLPGMVAALTPLPVIGVPVKGRILDGVDSLHSIVQMPRGVPVATVAINNATNAGLLAVRILGGTYSNFSEGMIGYMNDMRSEVETKIEKLESVGWEDY